MSRNILRRLFKQRTIMLDPCDGTETLAQARDVFTGIDHDFTNWRLDILSGATPATPVVVYELVQDMTFAQMFSSLPDDLNALHLSQHQIKHFVRKHKKRLRTDGFTTFFLFKKENKFFVALVRVGACGNPEVYVCRFRDIGVWRAIYRHRLVFPQR